MKKAVQAVGIVLFCGVLISILSLPMFRQKDTPVRSTMRAAEGAASEAVHAQTVQPQPLLNPAPTVSPLDVTDDGVLLDCASLVLDAIAERDYGALARLVHPLYGVTFTPYSTVDPESDLCFMPEEIAGAAADRKSYLWGFTDGQGEHISLTIEEYFDRYVWNADYRTAPQTAVDEVIASGNALENVSDIFWDSRFVEFHFPGLDPVNRGLDWCSLKVVLYPYEEQWRLVALIHSEWTI